MEGVRWSLFSDVEEAQKQRSGALNLNLLYRGDKSLPKLDLLFSTAALLLFLGSSVVSGSVWNDVWKILWFLA